MFYSEIFQNIGTGGYNLQQNQRTGQHWYMPKTVTSFTVRESGSRMGIATNSL
jgi:NOL1/NOP2/fmu family ribosome biogenesis protein